MLPQRTTPRTDVPTWRLRRLSARRRSRSPSHAARSAAADEVHWYVSARGTYPPLGGNLMTLPSRCGVTGEAETGEGPTNSTRSSR